MRRKAPVFGLPTAVLESEIESVPSIPSEVARKIASVERIYTQEEPPGGVLFLARLLGVYQSASVGVHREV